MLYYAKGSETSNFISEDLRDGLYSAFEKLGKRSKIVAVPPDITRFHSHAGELTHNTYHYYQEKLTDILPAIGTHFPMTKEEITTMFEDIPQDLFRIHKWKEDLQLLGEVPREFIEQVSEGKVHFSWPCQINKLLVDGGFDLILSIGQVVPHEVIGMAGYNKNILIGTGGRESIHRSHFLGAVYGMERMMGRADTPVRRVLNYASEHFASHLPIVYVLTVVGNNESGGLAVKGLFVGDDEECFKLAAELSLKVNFTMLSNPLKKVVVYLDPNEFKSTWLGNKSIYRTRMAIADGGELLVLAPGVREFGEDKGIDTLIRKYGYLTTPEILEAVDQNNDLNQNLGAAAHLIHGSSENRFTITYCPGHLSKQEIESVNFQYADLDEMLKIYNPQILRDGFNTLSNDEEIYFVSHPGLGLWAYEKKYHSGN
jgi:nickel-dependent lactate racemase